MAPPWFYCCHFLQAYTWYVRAVRLNISETNWNPSNRPLGVHAQCHLSTARACCSSHATFNVFICACSACVRAVLGAPNCLRSLIMSNLPNQLDFPIGFAKATGRQLSLNTGLWGLINCNTGHKLSWWFDTQHWHWWSDAREQNQQLVLCCLTKKKNLKRNIIHLINTGQ